MAGLFCFVVHPNDNVFMRTKTSQKQNLYSRGPNINMTFLFILYNVYIYVIYLLFLGTKVLYGAKLTLFLFSICDRLLYFHFFLQ